MMTRLFRPALIDALSVAAVLTAVAIAFWPTGNVQLAPFELPAAPAGSAVETMRTSGASTSAGVADSSAVVNANIFSSSRHAPRSRYTSPDAMLAAASVPAPAMAMRETNDSTGADSASAGGETVPQLSGIVSQDGVRRALLRLSNTSGAPQLMAEGDVRDGWVVVRIDADRVTLRPARRGATALRILRLAPRSQRDSSGTTP